MDRPTKRTSVGYILYFAIVTDRFILTNIPQITPLSKAIWDGNKGKLESIQIRNHIVFDPTARAGVAEVAEVSISEPALRNLYLHILELLKPHGIQVTSYKHHNYQEIYSFEGEGQASCSLRLFYSNS